MKKLVLQQIKQKYQISEDKVIGIYLFGSRVYGTSKNSSDYDYIVITNTNVNNQEIKHPIVNVHLYTKEHFQEMLNEHKIQALEVYFNNKDNMKDFIFKLDKSKLRKEISSVSNNSWVKCKKKLLVEENEYYIGIKSLFHSFRIIDFGIQIAKNKEIIDYSSTNWLWEELSNKYDLTWNYLSDKYKPLLNQNMSKFRSVAPKI